MIIYLSLVMGLLVGYLVNVWLGLATTKDPAKLIVTVIVATIVVILTAIGTLAHF